MPTVGAVAAALGRSTLRAVSAAGLFKAGGLSAQRMQLNRLGPLHPRNRSPEGRPEFLGARTRPVMPFASSAATSPSSRPASRLRGIRPPALRRPPPSPRVRSNAMRNEAARAARRYRTLDETLDCSSQFCAFDLKPDRHKGVVKFQEPPLISGLSGRQG